uniref:Wsv419-like protein n=1 Tax=Trachysalambria curvirostris nimavirus TaxID=2984282 RepID=A0A9C7F0S4_9VIRU|nr:MAG: wsv419-like protein [Trachysalambria curvirostris nimavirus]
MWGMPVGENQLNNADCGTVVTNSDAGIKAHGADSNGDDRSTGCVEVHASRLLSAQTLYGREIATSEHIRQWYADYRRETSRRAASVLLSVLVHYYRHRQPTSMYDTLFRLMLARLFTSHWRSLFPLSTIECAKVVTEPRSLPTIEDIYRRQSTPCYDDGSTRERDYALCCENLLLATVTMRPEKNSLSRCMYKHPPIVSALSTRLEMERLYKIAKSMTEVLELGGRL